jgi:hypothetical protein
VIYSCIGFAQDLFVSHKPVAITSLQRLAPAQTIGGYPILNLGNELVITGLKTVYAGGLDTGLPIGLAEFVDARDNAFFASIFMEANLAQSGQAADWTDEPCKKDDFLWKKSIGRNFSDINCATISHLTGFSQDYPTVVRVKFTRYSSTARRLSYIVNINPEMFGIERDAEPNWEASSWHKSHLQNDPKKVEFLAHLEKWAEDVQNKMNNAFDTETDAFSSIPPLSTYF